jgi:hypothetical protein
MSFNRWIGGYAAAPEAGLDSRPNCTSWAMEGKITLFNHPHVPKLTQYRQYITLPIERLWRARLVLPFRPGSSVAAPNTVYVAFSLVEAVV